VDAAVSELPKPALDRLQASFRRYRREATLRFFQVDLSLRDLCGEIAAIGDPVTALLREAVHVDH
jgi:hypothetical protein